MKLVFLLLCLPLLAWAGSMSNPQPVPNYFKNILLGRAITQIKATITQQMDEFNAIKTQFASVNESCTGTIDGMVTQCKQCAVDHCKARIADVCATSPDVNTLVNFGVQMVSGLIGDFFAEHIPSLVVDNLGGVAVDVGNFIIDSGLDLVSFFLDAGLNIADFGSFLADGFLSGVGEMADLFASIGSGALSAMTEIGSLLSSGFLSMTSAIGSLLGSLGSLIGKRAVIELRRRQTPSIPTHAPSCDEIKADQSRACSYYFTTCASCQADPTTVCPSYEAKLAEYMAAAAKVSWLGRMATQDVRLNSITVDAGSYNPSTNLYSHSHVSAHLFGTNINFDVPVPINPSSFNGGEAIGDAMIAEFARVTAPSRRRT